MLFLNWIPATKSHVKTGQKCEDFSHLYRDGDEVRAEWDNEDVLLRRRPLTHSCDNDDDDDDGDDDDDNDDDDV